MEELNKFGAIGRTAMDEKLENLRPNVRLYIFMRDHFVSNSASNFLRNKTLCYPPAAFSFVH